MSDAHERLVSPLPRPSRPVAAWTTSVPRA